MSHFVGEFFAYITFRAWAGNYCKWSRTFYIFFINIVAFVTMWFRLQDGCYIIDVHIKKKFTFLSHPLYFIRTAYVCCFITALWSFLMWKSITWNHVIAHIFNVFAIQQNKNSNKDANKRRACTIPRGIAHSHIHESACIDQLSKSIVVAHNLKINEKLILVRKNFFLFFLMLAHDTFPLRSHRCNFYGEFSLLFFSSLGIFSR